MVSDRDYAVRGRRIHKPDGSCEVIFDVANDRAPPLKPGFVRIEKLSGSWRFEPQGGKTHVVYTVFTDPGGSLPPFVVEGTRRKSALRKMFTMLGLGGTK